MRLPSAFFLLLIPLTLAFSACGGGGSSPVAPPLQQHTASPVSPTQQGVAFTIRIPTPPPLGAARRPAYISSAVQSVGITVAIVGSSPGPAVYANVATCPTPGGTPTCSLTVTAPETQDTITAAGYTATNGSGTKVSSGSVNVNLATPAASPIPLTLGGIVNSITFTLSQTTLPLGQAESATVTATDPTGATIVGPFDNPIALSGQHAIFFPNVTASGIQPSPGPSPSLVDSTSANPVYIGWAPGFASATSSTLSASGDGHTATATLVPATGFAKYDIPAAFSETVTNPTSGGSETEYESVSQAIVGPDGAFYFSTGQYAAGLPPAGAVHAYNPATGANSFITVNAQLGPLAFATDGSLWVQSATYSPMVRIASPSASGLASATAQSIPVPTPGVLNYQQGVDPSMGSIAEDGSGNIWFGEQYFASAIYSISASAPYTVTTHLLPVGPTGTNGGADAWGIAYGSDGKIYASSAVGYVNQINPATGTVTAQTLVPGQAALQAQFGPTMTSLRML
jgi:hypothetical protein